MKNDNQFPQWEVFIQTKNGGPFEHQGSLHAEKKKIGSGCRSYNCRWYRQQTNVDDL